jgi:hypothetical protein
MANGNQPQLLVHTEDLEGLSGSWVRPETFGVILEDRTRFSGLAHKGANPNLYFAAQKSCPGVTAGRSFLSMLNQMLSQMPSVMEDCNSIRNDDDTHLNASPPPRASTALPPLSS